MKTEEELQAFADKFFGKTVFVLTRTTTWVGTLSEVSVVGSKEPNPATFARLDNARTIEGVLMNEIICSPKVWRTILLRVDAVQSVDPWLRIPPLPGER